MTQDAATRVYPALPLGVCRFGAWSCCVGLVLVLGESLGAQRATAWSGNPIDAYFALIPVWMAFTLFAFVVRLGMESVAQRVQKFATIAACLMVGLCWFAIAYAADGGLRHAAAGATGLMLVGLVTGFTGPRASTMCAVGFAGTLFATFVAGEYWLMAPARPTYLIFVAGVGSALSLILCVTMGLGRARPGIRRFAWAVCALQILTPAVAWGYSTLHHATALPASQKNVVLIVSDTLRADVLSVYGGPVDTPHIKALASEGVQFDHAYSLAPWTPPSVSGFLTSSYPPGLNADIEANRATWTEQVQRYRLPNGQPTLAEVFRAAGYRTTALVGNPVASSLPGFDRGFDRVVRAHPLQPVRPAKWALLPNVYGALARIAPDHFPLGLHDTTAALEHYARRFLATRDDRPFFLYVHFSDPHSPYDPPKRFRPSDVPWTRFWPFPDYLDAGCPLDAADARLSPEDRVHARAMYEGEVRYVDEAVGRLRRTLAQRHVEDRTVVCFTADHGEELWDHGRWGHGHALYEESIHVPWLIAGPGVASSRVTFPVSLIDLAPTLAHAASIPSPASWKGMPLNLDAGIAESVETRARPVFVHATSHCTLEEPLQSVVLGEWKLVRGVRSGSLRLFKPGEDPLERHDLGETEPAVRAQLNRELDRWWESLVDPYVQDDAGDAGDRERLIEELRAIGYL